MKKKINVFVPNMELPAHTLWSTTVCIHSRTLVGMQAQTKTCTFTLTSTLAHLHACRHLCTHASTSTRGRIAVHVRAHRPARPHLCDLKTCLFALNAIAVRFKSVGLRPRVERLHWRNWVKGAFPSFHSGFGEFGLALERLESKWLTQGMLPLHSSFIECYFFLMFCSFWLLANQYYIHTREERLESDWIVYDVGKRSKALPGLIGV